MAPFVCPATSWSFDREHVCTQGRDDDFDMPESFGYIESTIFTMEKSGKKDHVLGR